MNNERERKPVSNITPFGLRLQPDLKRRLEAAATKDGRSLNAEISLRLQKSIDEEAKPKAGGMKFAKAAQAAAAESIEDRVAKLEEQVAALRGLWASSLGEGDGARESPMHKIMTDAQKAIKGQS